MTTTIESFATSGDEIEKIPVPISYDIIRLFSEGLYKSPHKAIEELVSNSYDAGASDVHVLLPDAGDEDAPTSPLWVVDNGHGMDVDGFRQLWRVADSAKADAGLSNGRLPIGQFGIGKLAAYVLAWHLMHLSRVDGRYLLTVMDFHKVTGRQADNPEPEKVSLREVTEANARHLIADVKARDPQAWKLLFDQTNEPRSWTVAVLTDFRDLYQRLSAGTLRWVLSTGLPLQSGFKIYLDGQRVTSSKEVLKPIKSVPIDKNLPGIGQVKGRAGIYEKPLTSGKSAEMGRSHGFFIRVRKRVINLEDELFGVRQPNHAAWARFMLTVEAEGLRDHLLSSREGVRDSATVREFREYLLSVFNQCRSAFDDWQRTHAEDLDLRLLVSDRPSPHIVDPLLLGVRNAAEAGRESFYIRAPGDIADCDIPKWLDERRAEIESSPFDEPSFVKNGRHSNTVRYDPTTRKMAINLEHPFVDKLTRGGKHRSPAKLFAASEVMLEAGLQEHGVDCGGVADFLLSRDRVLRLTAGEAPGTMGEVLRLLRVANQNKDALERATGAAFRLLGFRYERKGGNQPGADGVLAARLGRHGDSTEDERDYKLVYDAKQTDQPAVPADKVDPSSLEDYRAQEGAAYGFFVAHKYAGEGDREGKLNRKMSQGPSGPFRQLSLLTIRHLRDLVLAHSKHGLTLTDLHDMFRECRTVGEVDEWIKTMKTRFVEQNVPLAGLVRELEQLKDDKLAVPNVKAARVSNESLKPFPPSRLTARLRAVETIIGDRWLRVDESGDVFMHQTAEEILSELDRQIGVLDLPTGTADEEAG